MRMAFVCLRERSLMIIHIVNIIFLCRANLNWLWLFNIHEIIIVGWQRYEGCSDYLFISYLLYHYSQTARTKVASSS